MAVTQRQGPERESRATDAELMGRIRARDISAFEELYRAYRTRLSHFLFRLVRRPHLVEEIMNETLLVVWDRPDSFKGDSKLSTWIFAIAYRRAMKALRRFDDPIEDHRAHERVSLDPTPEEEIARDRARELLLRAIADLTQEHRTVVELTYFHEMGYQEIAEIMNCPVGTVKTRMFHARRHLRRALTGALPDWV